MQLNPTIINDFINLSREHFMTDQTAMSYDYDEEAAGHADDFANRINENGLYIGHFTKAEATVSGEKGTHGVFLEFEVPTGGGKTSFTLYTKKADGSVINVGMNKLQALMLILGVKSLRPVAGKVSKYNPDTNEREEVDGMVFPELLEKDIGCVFQKELYTGQDGSNRDRMNLLMFFDPKTRLSASEIRERKVKPEKLDKALKGLKTVDKRTQKAAEPNQPSVGAPAGEY